ncbi:glycerate kinase type-2 family protein [Arcobacter sp.]|uniref:glycerate kinase type-2 family protein n=1 Tax=Arcobacter sp. TaxID=1872629 RepID=UPI003C75813D
MLNKKELENIFVSILEEINPQKLIKKQCKFENDRFYINSESIEIPKNKKIHILGSGKAVLSMAEALYEIMEDKIEKALLVGAYENNFKKQNLTYIKSTHPIPSVKSVEGAKALVKEFEALDEDDFFIYLLSGGNSALVELPADEISLEEFQKTTKLMLENSMPIESINCVRKHISQVKGGRLARFTKAKGVVLTLSDVLGDKLEAIGSAPLYFDSTTFQDAFDALKKYNIFEKVPNSVQNYLKKALNSKDLETPKSESSNVKHYLIGSNDILLNVAKNLLEKKNLNPIIVDEKIDDDVEIVCKNLLQFCKEKKEGCFVFGGEATVNVSGNGKGGRNQHLVLSFLDSYPKDEDIIFLSAASDGIDGNSDASGAIIDKDSLKKVEELNLDIKAYMKNFDSNTFFDKLNQLLKPGPTHNNMLDIVIILINKNKGDKNV